MFERIIDVADFEPRLDHRRWVRRRLDRNTASGCGWPFRRFLGPTQLGMLAKQPPDGLVAEPTMQLCPAITRGGQRCNWHILASIGLKRRFGFRGTLLMHDRSTTYRLRCAPPILMPQRFALDLNRPLPIHCRHPRA